MFFLVNNYFNSFIQVDAATIASFIALINWNLSFFTISPAAYIPFTLVLFLSSALMYPSLSSSITPLNISDDGMYPMHIKQPSTFKLDSFSDSFISILDSFSSFSLNFSTIELYFTSIFLIFFIYF